MLLLFAALHVVQERISLALVAGQLLLVVRQTKVFLLCHEEGWGVTRVVNRPWTKIFEIYLKYNEMSTLYYKYSLPDVTGAPYRL